MASPGRFEFFEVLRGKDATGTFVPAQRSQEMLVAYCLDALVRALGALRSPDTGAGVDLVVSTGDNIDNAQWNELRAYLSLLGGGRYELGAGAAHSVQVAWPSDLYWQPEGSSDRWQRDFGFPHLPGLVDRVSSPFQVKGLCLPWVSCFGNHDGLPLGESIATPRYREILVAGRKPLFLPDGLDAKENEMLLFDEPERFLEGEWAEVPADPSRHVVGRREFVAAHLDAAGLPVGHGYRPSDLAAGRAYFSYEPVPGVRLIALDTANLDGWHEGSIGERQWEWLVSELMTCHRWFFSDDGRPTEAGGDDRLVVIASHHGLATMGNLRRRPVGAEDDHPRRSGAELTTLFGRFPNVVCWLNGHRHLNEIVIRRSPFGHSYVEISSASVADWPTQGRLVELVRNKDGSLSVLTTMLDHKGPLRVGGEASSLSPDELAALHRELAGNTPGGGFGSSLEGTPADRNVEVVLLAPF